ncbi:LOG family protein [Pseudoalteromonas sp. MMG010]|uniref:nucleotide 5'-monophosphate nucleosidase PpnN n=1 Tax=Pseudoalteromonas sp. MMG010 TaxID=2822685 RepID=UPI001B3A7144|nr:nucleotide 5'-monophosphate nucleosidase PpnN [Pseudoalteromonas sp. MMG010]MBQ4833410.1 LOG family protein [Pseudoalteromonas sp. MMG010]
MKIQLNPTGVLSLLSQLEVDLLEHSSTSERYRLFRNCVLAVLNVGSHTDDEQEIYSQFSDFDIKLISRERGIKIELSNPPATAFVDGEIMTGIHEHIFSVLRDILFICQKYDGVHQDQKSVTHMVFDMLRNAGALEVNSEPNMIVCWGGHSINEVEYKYTKQVGYELGLRGLNICTGCGPGAMKGPMKGATIGHAKQRISNNRYLGLTEPSIIAAEPPNPIVNELVILPDIEKRLEAFIRTAHAIIIFPGGAGTAEELLYLLGILLHPKNEKQCLPVILTGPKQSEAYFTELCQFIEMTLGEAALSKFEVIIDDPKRVATTLNQSMSQVRQYRKSQGDAYYFNWTLHIDPDFQRPFAPTHKNMASLDLHLNQPQQLLAANLRRAFSGIVAGNIKDDAVKAIKQYGPFILDGDQDFMTNLDRLLRAFVTQGRMKLPGTDYIPCYKLKT